MELQRIAAAALKERLRALARELPRLARRCRDIEPVHRARVACRRLRTVFAIFHDCFPRRSLKEWQREIRRLGRALGATRDVDVMTATLRNALAQESDTSARPGIRRLLLRQRQRREELQSDVESALQRVQNADVLAGMDIFTRSVVRRRRPATDTPESRKRAFETGSARLDALLAFAETVRHPEQIEELHRMRIAAKRLRYALEVLAPSLDHDFKPVIVTLKEIQDRLGEIHDCDVWLALLPDFLDDERRMMRRYLGHTRPMNRLVPGIEAFSRARHERRAAACAGLMQFWERLEQESFWPKVRQALTPPPPVLPDAALPGRPIPGPASNNAD